MNYTQVLTCTETMFSSLTDQQKENERAGEKRLWKGFLCLTGTSNGWVTLFGVHPAIIMFLEYESDLIGKAA